MLFYRASLAERFREPTPERFRSARRFHVAAAVFGILVPALLFSAGTAAGETEDAVAPGGGAGQGPGIAVDPEPPAEAIRFYAGTDAVSMYVSRGLVFSSRVSIQPWVELDVPVAEPEREAVDTISVFAGNWNSIQPGSPAGGEAPTGERDRLSDWFESDIYAGLRARFAGFWTTSLRFNYYTSPSDSFADIHEVDWRLSYSDAHLWEDAEGFALNPSLRVAKQTRNRPGPHHWYIETGLRPGGRLAGLPGELSLEVPLIVGFGADGQYETADEEHHLGFFQTGIVLGLPLDVLPENAGSLGVTAALDVIVVRDRELNFRGDRTTTVARTGLNYSF